MMEKQKTEIICEKCGEINEITQGNIKTAWLHTKDKKTYVRVMYVFCKRCNEKKLLQIDDKDTIKLKDKTVKELLRGKNRARYESLNERLNNERKDLEDYLQGLDLFDENEKFFIKVLTINRKGDIIDCNM
jgi:transcription initiation factor TFIIIB Brf1 subunit/transcription initiation factor TFIIB